MIGDLQAHVEARRRLHHVVTGRRASRRRITPQQVPSWQSYARTLLDLTRYARGVTMREITPLLPDWVAEHHADALPKAPGEAFAGIKITLNDGAFSFKNLSPVVDRIARGISVQNKRSLERQLRSAFGVEVPIFDKGFGQQVRAFTATNVSLIQSIPEKALRQVENLVLRSVAEGKRAKEISRELSERWDISERSAVNIARDQTLKFHASLNRTRQQALGISTFIWTTANNEKVCPECSSKDGKRYKWSNPPGGGPGMIHPNCQCSADPDTEAFLDSL